MRRCALLTLIVALGAAASAAAQDATVEVSQATLNKLLQAVGTPSDSGSFQSTRMIERLPGIQLCDQLVGFLDCPVVTPPSTKPGGSDRRIPLFRCRRNSGGFTVMPAGPSITWEWWITNASFTVSNGSMSVTATVRRRAGTVTTETTGTTSAVVRWSGSTNRLEIDVTDWRVPFEHDGQTITTIDVARYLEVGIPVPAQVLTVPLPNGSTRTINGRVLSASPQYQAGRVVVTLDLGF